MQKGCHEAPTEEQSRALMVNRLRILSGRNFGYDPAAAAEAKEAAIAAWEHWFETDGEINVTFEAELLEVGPTGDLQP